MDWVGCTCVFIGGHYKTFVGFVFGPGPWVTLLAITRVFRGLGRGRNCLMHQLSHHRFFSGSPPPPPPHQSVKNHKVLCTSKVPTNTRQGPNNEICMFVISYCSICQIHLKSYFLHKEIHLRINSFSQSPAFEDGLVILLLIEWWIVALWRLSV